VKSSTGFYTTENNVPNGATIPSIMLMLENATPLPVKAADRTYDEAVEMIKLEEANRDFWGKSNCEWRKYKCGILILQ
jgi:deoxyribose-phosphate aldolase